MKAKHRKALRKYGEAICLKALEMNEEWGNGARTIGFELGLTTNQADAAINAGRALSEERRKAKERANFGHARQHSQNRYSERSNHAIRQRRILPRNPQHLETAERGQEMNPNVRLTDELKEEVKTFKEFCRAYEIKGTMVKVDDRPDMDSWGQGASHYVFVLRSSLLKGHVTGYYSMGSAHKKPPKPSEILQCLALDSSSAAESFEDWCNEDLMRFLGQEAFDHLMNCEEE